ncbi:MAG: radical SAM-associated putative lipoprotein [Paludibacteraceae bacterium]
MKRLHRNLLRRLNQLFGSFIALLGFSMCSTSQSINNGDIVAMYGVPSAEYHINGTVKDADSQQPIDSIRVVVRLTDYESDTMYTDAQGQYALDGRRWPSNSAIVQVDDERGNYQSETKTVDLVFEGEQNTWFQGTTYTTVDFDVQPIEKQ